MGRVEDGGTGRLLLRESRRDGSGTGGEDDSLWKKETDLVVALLQYP